MPDGFSKRLFSLLQLTRMALVFSALSNILTGYLLQNGSSWSALHILLLALICVSLYGLGISLNDIIDRRKDAALAAWRPLPSGMIRLRAAHAVCVSLAFSSLIFGFLFARSSPSSAAGAQSWSLIIAVLFLILFYNLFSKWIAGFGILTLALIRMIHALIGDPLIPVPWHPLIIFFHVLILALINYRWEEKRPLLTVSHLALLPVGALLVSLGLLLFAALNAASPRITGKHLWVPLLLALFLLVVVIVKSKSPSLRAAGQRLNLVGTLWLILYDAAFLWIHNGVAFGWIILAFLPLSAACLLIMKWWNQFLWLAQPIDYKREHSGPLPPSI
jgi:4-hydroxybenzoate polyprenyltransferase